MTVTSKRFLFILFIFFLAINTFPSKVKAFDVRSPSAIVIDQETGRIFFAKNAHEKRRIASITKIMTAIIAIESGKLDEIVTVSEKAVYTEGSSIYLQPNEKIRLIDLIYGLMLRSGNDAAVSIAEHVGGSVEGFVYLMNEKAKQIGMFHTHFANPHGLDDHENHYSTAYDMALLTKYAMQNKIYRKIAGTKMYRSENVDRKEVRIWHNKNRLLTELYRYSTGGKTGYTKRAKRTLVSTASKNELNLIAVTLNTPSQDDWNDHISMFEHVFQTYQMTEILPEGEIKIINNPFYKNRVYLKVPCIYPLKEEEKNLLKVHYKVLKPKKEWRKNSKKIPSVVGKAEIYLGDEKIRTIPIYFNDKKQEKKSFFDWFQRLFGLTIGVYKND